MKITIYELIGLIKDKKAPKKIKYDDKFWKLEKYNGDYKNEDTNLFEYLFKHFNTNFFINNEVEIIEEPKKIEKIKQLNNVANCKELTELEDKQQINNHILKDKINKLIDEINNLKEK